MAAKQIYQQTSLGGDIDENNSYLVIDMLEPSSGKYITYRVTPIQLRNLFACNCLNIIKTTLKSSDILNLFTTPITIVPAAGPGTIVIPISFTGEYNYGTTPYVTNTTLLFQNNGNSSAHYNVFVISGSVNLFSDTQKGGIQGSGLPLTALENQSLIVTSAGNPTGGDGTLTLYTAFTILTV